VRSPDRGQGRQRQLEFSVEPGSWCLQLTNQPIFAESSRPSLGVTLEAQDQLFADPRDDFWWNRPVDLSTGLDYFVDRAPSRCPECCLSSLSSTDNIRAAAIGSASGELRVCGPLLTLLVFTGLLERTGNQAGKELLQLRIGGPIGHCFT
jgi:hypothetical protein